MIVVRDTRRLGIVLLVTGVLAYLAPLVFSLVAGEQSVVAYRPVVTLICSASSAAVIAWVAFSLWRSSDLHPGTWLLLSAAFAYGAYALSLVVLFAAQVGGYEARVESLFALVAVVVHIVAFLSLWTGLFQARIVGRWVLWIGILGSATEIAFLAARSAMLRGQVEPAIEGALTLAGIASTGLVSAAFWIALSAVLITSHKVGVEALPAQ